MLRALFTVSLFFRTPIKSSSEDPRPPQNVILTKVRMTTEVGSGKNRDTPPFHSRKHPDAMQMSRESTSRRASPAARLIRLLRRHRRKGVRQG